MSYQAGICGSNKYSIVEFIGFNNVQNTAHELGHKYIEFVVFVIYIFLHLIYLIFSSALVRFMTKQALLLSVILAAIM